MYGLCLSGAIIISIFTIVNNYFKVSLHATGVGIFTGFLLAYFSEQIFFNIWILALAFIISGIVLSSRLFLEKHTPKELIVGYVFSFLITFALNLFYPFGN
jgi:membrane-associated phospholipid phosphatase